jgi:Rps23 Pro-64 3,4-dihydroxylase Tpa1-like proline 4-hydroxylase
MTSLDRVTMAQVICRRLDENIAEIARQWNSSGSINHFVIDDLLPVEWAQRIRDAFPRGEAMMLRRSLREVKYVAAQMNHYNPLLEEAIYAFQQPEIVERVGRITQLRALEPDSLLYAGGISLMAPGHYLNPHVDNSHDKARERYRVINLLYYVSPEWAESAGGNLELWPQGPHGQPVTVVSRFNRLAVMVTHQQSWHSVSPVAVPRDRCCVSNYYFSRHPVGDAEYFHVTTFRGRPEQHLRDLVLRVDGWARAQLRGLFPQGATASRHYYERDRNKS